MGEGDRNNIPLMQACIWQAADNLCNYDPSLQGKAPLYVEAISIVDHAPLPQRGEEKVELTGVRGKGKNPPR